MAQEVLFIDLAQDCQTLINELEQRYSLMRVQDLVQAKVQIALRSFMVIVRLSSDALNELQQLKNAAITPQIILVSHADATLSREMVKLQVRDFFVDPVQSHELCLVLDELALEKKSTQGRSQVSTLMNAKGGAGSTFLSANLAQMLAKLSRQSTVLMDLDLQFSGMDSYFDMKPEYSLATALAAAESLDLVGLQGYLLRHKSGLRILSGVAREQEIRLLEEIPHQGLVPLITLLKSAYDNIIIDLPRQFNLLSITALQESDRIFIVMQQDLTHMNNMMRMLQLMRQELLIDDSKIHIIVNRYDKKSFISIDEIRKMTRVEAIDIIANDFKVSSLSLNTAEAVFEFASERPLCKQLMGIENRLGGSALQKRTGFFKRFLNGGPKHV